MSSESPRVTAYEAAMAAARERLARREPAPALFLLERAHVLGQRDFSRHWRVHVLMLRAAWNLADGREIRGQMMRLALTPIGHLTQRLPRGNNGRSNVNAFKPMTVSDELARLLETENE